MKAWLVRDKDEFCATVVFAETRGKARALAMHTEVCEDVDFIDIEVRRKPQMDKYYKEGKIDKIFTTNLIYQTPELLSREWYCSVNMSKYIALLVDTLNCDNSISSLLDPVDRIKKIVAKYENRQ